MTEIDDSLYFTKKEIRKFFYHTGLTDKIVDEKKISSLSHNLIQYFPKTIKYENLEDSVSKNLNSVYSFISKPAGETTCITPEFTSTKIAADYVWASITNEYFDTSYIR